MEGAALVLLCVDPGAHCEFCDKDIATFREEDWCFGGDHLHVWVGLHDFLDAGERQLVEFVVVGFGFEVVDYVLPVCGEDVFVSAVKTLIDLLQI